jgi:hypothetical protein
VRTNNFFDNEKGGIKANQSMNKNFSQSNLKPLKIYNLKEERSRNDTNASNTNGENEAKQNSK